MDSGAAPEPDRVEIKEEQEAKEISLARDPQGSRAAEGPSSPSSKGGSDTDDSDTLLEGENVYEGLHIVVKEEEEEEEAPGRAPVQGSPSRGVGQGTGKVITVVAVTDRLSKASGVQRLYHCFECGQVLDPRGLGAQGHACAAGKGAGGGDTRSPPGTKPHVCAECGKGFEWLQSLKEHRRVHTGERPYRCQLCGKSFLSSGHLRQHQQTHADSKPHQCAACGKRFSRAKNLEVHQRVHTGERPYLCAVCHKSFPYSSTLKQHLRTHTGERPFQCAACGKRFARAKNLKVHERVHTGARPYRCGVCGESFAYAPTLKTHERTHP
nr:PREDICTED: gastrula zinc finger protein XlCGF7.1-like [Lepisosteus oculatus]XP_015195650.1 PREDICTED: gastrula zinc finger protein XlCGF7.1-like [Lepisosteus oculatus]XP_015195655.1 PREDICTED: gastrula zinc finger protein XlCGF7.1-like [Lepisosteus oculatus]